MIRHIYWFIVIAFIGACLGMWGAVTAFGVSSGPTMMKDLTIWAVLFYVLLIGQYIFARSRLGHVPPLTAPYPHAVMGSSLLMWVLALVPFNLLGHIGAQLCGITPGTGLWEIAANVPSLFPLVPALWLAPRAIALDDAVDMNGMNGA